MIVYIEKGFSEKAATVKSPPFLCLVQIRMEVVEELPVCSCPLISLREIVQ